MYGDFSYFAQINKKTKFRIGLKGGFTNYASFDNNSLLKSDEIDPTYQERINKSMLHVGAGGFLYSDRYYFGFSVPKIINNKFKDEGDSFALSCEQQHYYLMSGLAFKLGRNLVFI